MNPPSLRCFIGLELSDSLKQTLHILQQEIEAFNDCALKWTSIENLHVTLKFLGPTSPDKLNDIRDILDHTCEKSRKITSHITKLGAFPDLINPRILWTDLDDISQQIRSLVQTLENELEHLGFARNEHPFFPHITLARVKGRRPSKKFISKYEKLTVPRENETFKNITLFQSTLTQQGPVYHKVHRASFQI